MFDLKIMNGSMISGLDEPPRHGDLAIRKGRIVAMGAEVSAPAQRVLDVKGKTICPGFIDLHTHCLSGANSNYIRSGVTTVVGGNCGFGRVAPDIAEQAQGRRGPNMALLSGHNSIRNDVMGNVRRAPSSAELDRMIRLVADDMANGAMGFSSGLTYVPGNYAETSELIALARPAADAGGIYTSHMRDESIGLLDSIAETARIGDDAGLPAHISHIKADGADVWGKSAAALAALDAARAHGTDITWDQYPYTASNGRMLLLFSQWLQEGSEDDLRTRFLNSGMRSRAKADLIKRIQRKYNGDPSRVVIATAPEPALMGRTLADAAVAAGRTPSVADVAETVLDLVARYPQQTAMYCVFHSMAESDVQRFLRHPVTMIGSDGWSVVFGEGHHHPRQYGTFPRVLGHYVRDARVLDLPDAVRRMTRMPAARLGLTDRGILEEGAWADLVVFDPDTIRDMATFEAPHQYPEGIEMVIVNGNTVVENGRETGCRAGRFLVSN